MFLVRQRFVECRIARGCLESDEYVDVLLDIGDYNKAASVIDEFGKTDFAHTPWPDPSGPVISVPSRRRSLHGWIRRTKVL